jgi:hypothetical protein
VRVAAGTTSIDAAKITDRRPTAASAAYAPKAAISTRNADAAPSTYPDGVSTLSVSSTQTGWPYTFGTVTTVRNAGIRIYQEFVEANGNNPPIAVRRWYRQGYSDGTIDAWGPFQKLLTSADRIVGVAVNGTQADFGTVTTRTLSTTLSSIPSDWEAYRLTWAFTAQLQSTSATTRDVTVTTAFNGAATLFGTQGHVDRVAVGSNVITTVTGYLDVAAGTTGNRTFDVTLTASALDAALKSDNLTVHVTATRP